MPLYPAWNETQAADIIGAFAATAGGALPALQALQEVFGYISDRAIEMVAAALNLSRAEVYGVVSFYHDFRREPPGAHLVKLCRAEACQAVGGDNLAHKVKERFRIDWHGTSADGRVTLEPVFCLGLCSCGPAAMVDGKLFGRATLEVVAKSLA